MKICKHCNHSNYEDAKFCKNCGKSLETVEDTQEKQNSERSSKPQKRLIMEWIETICTIIIVYFIYTNWNDIKQFFSKDSKVDSLYTEEKITHENAKEIIQKTLNTMGENVSSIKEQEKIQKTFNTWVEQQITLGVFTRESIPTSGDDGGIKQCGYSDLNKDGKLDALYQICFYYGGNEIPCTSYLVLSGTNRYTISEISTNSIKNFKQLNDCFSETKIYLNRLVKNRIEGTFMGYLENDPHCCPSITEDIIIEYDSKEITSIGMYSFKTKINEYSYYKALGTYTGSVKAYILEDFGKLSFLSKVEDATIDMKLEKNELCLYENETKTFTCTKLAKASNGYAFDIKFTNKEANSFINGFSQITFNETKYHGSINTHDQTLKFSYMINSENLSYLYTILGINISEFDLIDSRIRGIVLTYDLNKNIY